MIICDARYAHNFVHSGTRENVRHCYSTRATMSLLRLHARYTLDTLSGRQRRKIPDKPPSRENLVITRKAESLKMSRYVTCETVDHRYTMRFLGIIDMRKYYLSNIATIGDDSNISMIIICCRNFYISIINALIRVCLNSRAWSSRYYILLYTFQEISTNYIYFIF